MRNHRVRKLVPVLLSLAMLFVLFTFSASAEGGKTDVWDFGAEQLDAAQYNNKLTVEEINSWYPAMVTPGSEGNTIASFTSSDGELSFNDGGKPATHRLRTMNTALTRRDAKSLTGADGTVYSGYIYSNSGANPEVYVSLNCNAGDAITVIVGSNGGDSTINFEGPSGVEDSGKFVSGGAKAQELKFYPKETGTYKFYSTDEKLVIARIYRESARTMAVSGTVTAPAGLENYSVAFTNRRNGAVTSAPVSGGKYTAQLQDAFVYDVSLLNANGYIVTSENSLTVGAAGTTFDLTVQAVDLVTVKGNIVGLSAEALANLTLKFAADTVYVPTLTVTGNQYTAVLAKGDTYVVDAGGVNDYALTSANTLSYTADAAADITFTAKPTYPVTITPVVGSRADMVDAGVADATYTFTNLDEESRAYAFTGMGGITLRDGRYDLVVTGLKNGYTQKITSYVVVNGAATSKQVGFEKIDASALPYKATVTVGKSGCDYTTVGGAIAAIRRMKRPNGERVTVSIQPGNYEEMLVVDVPNVSLVNASAAPSTAVTNKGVDIDPNAVRITWYYGHGYNYYSMGSDCKYNADLLAANKENGEISFVNPGAGTAHGSYWNSSVVVSADGFEAKGIIFENSFNQYVSPKSLEDVIEANGAKEGATPRSELKTAGDTTVQDKAYVERAGALAIANNCKNIYFENCKFIGRQDTLFGGAGATAAFYDCQVVGSTDYIYGPMTAVFAKCGLVFNTSESSNDRGYVTAPQQTSGRGFLMYNCNITSTTPGVDTASEKVSKPGYFGRPWAANTGEAVFYETVIGTASDGTSLIHPDGWLNTLSGTSALCGEYNTHELTAGVDNSAQRVAWAGKFDGGKLADGTAIDYKTWLGGWNPFEGKDMTISTAGAAPSGTGFADVPADMYCAPAVTWAVDNKVTTGTSATTFSPAQTCSDAEILTFLWRAAGSPEPAANVGDTYYYTKSTAWAAEQKITENQGEPDMPCTRAMVCTYLWRLAGSPEAKAADFTDVPGGSSYAKAVSWAVATGITNGTGAGNFSPDRVCSRGEIITFLYRNFVQSLGK